MNDACIKFVALAGMVLVSACRQEKGGGDAAATVRLLLPRPGEPTLEDASPGFVDAPRSANSDTAKGAHDAAGATIEAARTEDAATASTAPHTVCITRDPDAPSATSQDGKTIVFVSTDPTRKDMTAVGDFEHEDICISRDGAPPKLLLAGHETDAVTNDGGPASLLTAFNHFLFSADGATLYFESTQWVDENAAFAVDLATGKERFVTAGTIIAVIPTGPYRGDVVSRVRESDEDFKGKTTKFFVVTPSGTRVHRLLPECTDRRECGPHATCVTAEGATHGACLAIR